MDRQRRTTGSIQYGPVVRISGSHQVARVQFPVSEIYLKKKKDVQLWTETEHDLLRQIYKTYITIISNRSKNNLV